MLANVAGNWANLKTYKNDASDGSDIANVAGTTEYSQEFTSLDAATCYTFGVTAEADCKGDQSVTPESPTKQTVQGCTSER